MRTVTTTSMAHDPQAPVRPELADVRRLARRVMRSTVRAARRDELPSLTGILREHLGGAVDDSGVVVETWPAYEHVNVQAGVDSWLDDGARQHRLVGIVGFQEYEFGLAELLAGRAGFRRHGPRPGNVARVKLAAGPGDETRACVRCGLYLVTEHGQRAAVLLRAAESHSDVGLSIQVAATDDAYASVVAAQVRELTIRHNVFRGHVLSFGRDVFEYGSAVMKIHQRPVMAADQLIMPAQTLETVQRQVVDIARHATRLAGAGQHVKRGLLLHGPPGVGKTHTIRYLLSQLSDTTVIELTGSGLGMIAEACSVARTLQPAMVVVEDVDLIAEDRDHYRGGQSLLFELLNQMDGLAEEADVVFVLTTNRADLLEPALAARPGRVDQAVELTLPDAEARRRLFDLYRGGLLVDESRLDSLIERMDGVTASFLKELLRRAAVFAAIASPDEAAISVSADNLDAALDELMETRNSMTRTLLGAGPPSAPPRGGGSRTKRARPAKQE